MRIKNYIKKLLLFDFKERINILFFSFGTLIFDRLNKNIVQTYLIFAELQRKKIEIEKKDDSNIIANEINNKKFEVILKRDSSDALVFNQLLIEHEYEDIISLFQEKNLSLKTMIDAGANIGLASIYFKAYYPELDIVALEPSKETYQRLAQNLKVNNVQGVKPLEQGLWKENTMLQLDKDFRDKSDWSFRLLKNVNAQLNTIKVQNVETILKDNHWEVLDLLKIDIEGGETAIFESQEVIKEWLPKVKVLALEIHDEYNCREKIYALLKQNNFSLLESKSLTIAVNSKLT